MRRALIAAGCTTALSALVLSCSAPAATNGEGTSKKAGHLAFADTGFTGKGPLTVQLDYDSVEPEGLDPQSAGTARSWSIESLVYEPLVTIGHDFSVKPMLASAWTRPDPTTYVFTLRKGVKFSNGRVMTPDDVVGSLRRLVKSSAPYARQLGPVTSVTATGPHRVTVKLGKPYTPFLAALANTPAAVLPMKELTDGSLNLKSEMLGTGPFVMKEHRQDRSWAFDPNPAYRDAGRLRINRLNVEIVPQEATRLAALRNGSADFVFFNNVDALDQLSGTRNAEVVSQRNSDFFYLIQNSKNKNSALSHQKVRFALNSAIDRKQIADIAFGGRTQPTGVTPSVLPGSCDVKLLPAAKAGTGSAKAAVRAALDEAGVKDLRLRLAVYTSEPALGQIAQVIQQQYAKAGVTVEILKYDDTTHNAKVFGPKPDFDLAIGWFAGYTDPAMVPRWWNPKAAGFPAAFLNNDEKFNTLLETAASQPAGRERAGVLTEMCRSVDTEAGMVPLVSRPTVIGYRSDKVSPTLYSAEGYGNILRNIVDFTLPAAK
ncbi:ABC transporter substrate-binding protein [Streptomyces sp. NPDC055078]